MFIYTKDQKVEMQLNDLREYARARKHNLTSEYIGYAFGVKADCQNYKKLNEDIRIIGIYYYQLNSSRICCNANSFLSNSIE